MYFVKHIREGGENMKKRIMLSLIVITLVASLSIHAFATSPRGIAIIPNLTFSGTTANCSVNVIGNNLTDKIEAEIKLWEGSRCLKTCSGRGCLCNSLCGQGCRR